MRYGTYMGRGDRQPVSRLSRGMIAALRVQMARRGIDQTRLGEAAGLSAAYFSKRLNAQMVFTLHDVERLAMALDMQPEELMAEAVAEMQCLPRDLE